jgi:RNA polymerase sigma-70 factor (ECF subfamily)
VVFEQQRPHLRGLAYRMTGSLAEAEDLLQEAYLKWCRVSEPVNNPQAYLSKLVTRLCLDSLKSARVRRETYVGTWLPEPVLDASSVQLEAGTELAHDISVALLMALERLSPLERAAFLLHDVFDVDYTEVAQVLSKSEVACRQLAARARAHVQHDCPRYQPTEIEMNRVLSAFAAATAGDIKALESVLAEAAVLYSDGGGRVAAATRPIVGRDRIVRFLVGAAKKGLANKQFELRPVSINGLPGLVLLANGQVVQTFAFELQDGQVEVIYIVRNPDKLTRVPLH